MAKPKGQDPGDAGLVFAAHNTHDERCGPPPRLRNTDNPGLVLRLFREPLRRAVRLHLRPGDGDRHGPGGDLGWGDPKSFTLGLLEEVVRDTQRVAARIAGPGRTETSGLLVIDAAWRGVASPVCTGKDEVIWLRACRKRPGMAATRSWSDAYLQSPISPIIFLTRAFGPVPIVFRRAGRGLDGEINAHPGNPGSRRLSVQPSGPRSPPGGAARPCVSSSGGTSR